MLLRFSSYIRVLIFKSKTQIFSNKYFISNQYFLLLLFLFCLCFFFFVVVFLLLLLFCFVFVVVVFVCFCGGRGCGGGGVVVFLLLFFFLCVWHHSRSKLYKLQKITHALHICHLHYVSPCRVGRHIVFALSVCPSVCLSQNRVRSVTQKPFEIFSWNFTQMQSNMRRRAECKNHNSGLRIFRVMALWNWK